MTWKGEDVTVSVQAAALRGLQMAGEHILEESNRTIPHNEGTMQDSGEVSVDGSKLEASVSYDTPYTVRQHEDTSMRHPNGRKAKFLETALNEQSNAGLAIIANEIEKSM
jgi:hypothetical protein